MEWSFQLKQSIANFLRFLPILEDKNGQKTFIYTMGLDSELQDQLNFDSPRGQFVRLLITTVAHYETLKDGRNALEAILTAAKEYVGQEGKNECEQLIGAIKKERAELSTLRGMEKEFLASQKNIVGNPYTAGPPVYGKKFYGRDRELQKVLDSEEKQIWFIANKRIGKTSFLHQIQYLCENRPEYRSNIGIIWNLQGNYTRERAKKSLLSTANAQLLKEVDWPELQELSSCHEVIKTFCKTYENLSFKKTILLLVNETDPLLSFAAQNEYDELEGLRDVFEGIPNLRVVLVGSPKICDLYLYKEKIPNLLERFEPEYLRELEEEEARALIGLSSRPAAVVDEILENSNRIPFYIQYLCREIVNAPVEQDPLQVIENSVDQSLLSPYLQSTFGELHPFEKIISLLLVKSPVPLDGDILLNQTKEVIPKIQGQTPTLKLLIPLVNSGMIKKSTDNTYSLLNQLFARWLSHDLENLWNKTVDDLKEADN